MSTTLLLNCLIQGEDKIFTVTAAGDKNVSFLKKSIQEERVLGTLKGVDPHDLELWKVNVIDDPLCEMTLLFSAQGFQPHRRQTTLRSR